MRKRRRKRKAGLAMGWALLLLAGGLSLVGPAGLIARAAAQGGGDDEGPLSGQALSGAGDSPALVGHSHGPQPRGGVASAALGRSALSQSTLSQSTLSQPALGELNSNQATPFRPSRGRDDQMVGRGVKAPWSDFADYVVSLGHLTPQEADEILRQIWGWAQTYGRDPWLDVAVVTIESVWNPNVESYMGARGLYQIMPGTGDWLAEALGVPGYTTAALFEPKTSIYLGSYYLHQKYLQHGGDWHRALTAYNRGDGGLASWIKEAGTAETLYSQRVLELSVELKELYGK